MGIIDCLSKGFRAVNKHWWVLLVPILLDTFLWLGPHASVEHILQNPIQILQDEVAALPSEVSPELMDAFRALLEDVARDLNLFSSLRVGTLGVPSLFAWGATTLSSPSAYETLWVRFLQITNMPDMLLSVPDTGLISVLVWQVPNVGIWLLLTLFFSLGGILVGSAYLSLVSSALSSAEEPAPFWPRTLRLSGHILLFWALRIAAILVAGIPFLVVFVILSSLSSGLAILFTTIVMGLVTWLSFYAIFFVSAMVVNGASVLRALWNSFNVVMRNFWSTLWLFLLINLIGGGLTILWTQLTNGSWPTLISILGNAYVGSGLVSASLIFYQDRYARWQEVINELRAKGQGLAA